jgi:hypothetical protein
MVSGLIFTIQLILQHGIRVTTQMVILMANRFKSRKSGKVRERNSTSSEMIYI